MKHKKTTKKSSDRMKRLYQDEALQKRIKDSRESKRGRRSNIFKPGVEIPTWFPDKGDHILDIVPYLAGSNDPATEEGNPTYTFEYLVHRLGPNQDEYICRRMYGKKCPACERREKLREDDNDDYKKWWPKPRNLYNIICHDNTKERKKGIQVMDIAQFYFEQHLVKISRVPSRGGEEDKTINFVHPKKGRSISFTVEPKKGKDDYPKFIGHTLIKRDYSIDEKILASAFQLDELVRMHSYEEMKKAMTQSEEDEENESSSELANELLEQLEEISSMKSLIKFCKKNDFEVDEDSTVKKQKRKVKEQIEEMMDEEEDEGEEDDDGDDDPDDDDYGSDDDDDPDDDPDNEDDSEEDDIDGDEDEDEEEDENDVDLETIVESIEDFKELKNFIKEYDIEFKINKNKSIDYNKKKLIKVIE